MEKVIETEAPISIDNLKLYFEDKETTFIIDYAKSSLKSEKLLTYLGNLDLPCDLSVEDENDMQEIIKAYLNSNFIINIPLLELVTIHLLAQKKGIFPVTDQSFLDNNKEELDLWEKRIDSLGLYNLYMLNDKQTKDMVEKQIVAEDDGDTRGINFVSLIKYPDFYQLLTESRTNNMNYYPTFFNEYVFKGQNLFHYWANPINPYYVMTQTIASGAFNPEDLFNNIAQEQTK